MKYPDIQVQLTGEDGNAGAIIGAVSRELRRAGVRAEEVTRFQEEAMSGDYDNLLCVCMDWVDVR